MSVDVMDAGSRTPLVAEVYDAKGKRSAEIDLPAGVFGVQPNMAVMHQAYLRQLANARQGTAATRTRGNVSGGGAKPYRQKGTGRARHGSNREPSMVGGGTVFGPQPRSFRQDMPRKMRRLALRSALSVKAQEGRVRVLEGFDLEEPSTGEVAELLRSAGVEHTALVVLAASNLVVQRSVSNLPWAKAILWSNLNLYDLFTHDELLVQKGALEALWETFGAEDGSSYDADAATRAVEVPEEEESEEAQEATADESEEPEAKDEKPSAPAARKTAPEADDEEEAAEDESGDAEASAEHESEPEPTNPDDPPRETPQAPFHGDPGKEDDR